MRVAQVPIVVDDECAASYKDFGGILRLHADLRRSHWPRHMPGRQRRPDVRRGERRLQPDRHHELGRRVRGDGVPGHVHQGREPQHRQLHPDRSVRGPRRRTDPADGTPRPSGSPGGLLMSGYRRHGPDRSPSLAPCRRNYPLVGRERELSSLAAFVDASTELPAALLFEGEAGMGKTMLWQSGIEMAREHGFRILEARPVVAESALAFAALGDLLADVLGPMLPRLPDPQARRARGGTPPPPDRRLAARPARHRCRAAEHAPGDRLRGAGAPGRRRRAVARPGDRYHDGIRPATAARRTGRRAARPPA